MQEVCEFAHTELAHVSCLKTGDLGGAQELFLGAEPHEVLLKSFLERIRRHCPPRLILAVTRLTLVLVLVGVVDQLRTNSCFGANSCSPSATRFLLTVYGKNFLLRW